MEKIISIFVLIFIMIMCYIFFYHSEIFVEPQHCEVTNKNDKIEILVSRSYSATKWQHKYFVNGNDVYIKLYEVCYLNPLNTNRGFMYRFEMPAKFDNYYIYDKTGEPILIYQNIALIGRKKTV